MSEINLDDAFEEQVAVEEAELETSEEVSQETTQEEGSTTEPKESWTFSQAMDEREKRQQFERENKELKEQLAKREEKDVSIFDDEAGYNAQQDKKLNEQLTNNTLNMSEAFAEEVFGAERVGKAVEWFKAEGAKSPYVMNRFNTAKLPYHEIVKMFDDEQARLEPEAYKEKLKAEVIAELEAEKPPEHKSITPSLASKRSSGKTQPPEDYEDMLGE